MQVLWACINPNPKSSPKGQVRNFSWALALSTEAWGWRSCQSPWELAPADI